MPTNMFDYKLVELHYKISCFLESDIFICLLSFDESPKSACRALAKSILLVVLVDQQHENNTAVSAKKVVTH